MLNFNINKRKREITESAEIWMKLKKKQMKK